MKPIIVATTLAFASLSVAYAASSLTKEEQMFVKKAAVGGMTEVQAGDLAKSKGKDEKVKEFGARMVTDHSKANAELKTLAESKGGKVPEKLDPKHQATIDKLSKLSGDEFDKAYIADMVEDHKKDVKEFEEASKMAKDPDLKGFIDKTLTVIRGHLEHVEQVQKTAAK